MKDTEFATTKRHLIQLFLERRTAGLYDSQGVYHQGVISSIQHEDGSGSSFNITTEGGQKYHIRTID